MFRANFILFQVRDKSMKRHTLSLSSLGIGLLGVAVMLPGATQLLSAKPTLAQGAPTTQSSQSVGSAQAPILYAQNDRVDYDLNIARGLYLLLEARAYLKSSSSSNALRDDAISYTEQAIESAQKGIRYSFDRRNPSLWSRSEFYNPRARVYPNDSDRNSIKLQKALTALENAKSAFLRDGGSDPSGYRYKTISLTDSAISRTRRALQYAGNPDLDPNMASGLAQLKNAQKSLQNASGDKGGHRYRSLLLIEQAIKEAELGLEYDRDHTSNDRPNDYYSRPNPYGIYSPGNRPNDY